MSRMSQSHILKFGLIPAIAIVTLVATAQGLTTLSADGHGQTASQPNVEKTKVFSSLTTARGSDKSQTESAIIQPSVKIAAEKNNSVEPKVEQKQELSSAEISAGKNSATSSTNPGQKLSAVPSATTPVADRSKPELPELTPGKNPLPEKDAPKSTPLKSPQSESPNPSGSVEKPHTVSDSQPETNSLDSQKPASSPVVVPYRELPPMPQPQTTPVVVPYRELPPMPQPQATSETNYHKIIPTDWSENNVLFELFATPDAPGVLAIGTAEGTVTASGQLNSSYWGHTDPGNGANNLGTFSYQHGAPTPRQADWRQLRRLQRQVETILGQAQEQNVKLSALELVAGADLLNQAPAAGMSYVENLKKARARGNQGINAVLEARVMSFVNPETGVLEASGFGNNWEVLRQDQWRRLVELHQTLQLHGAI